MKNTQHLKKTLLSGFQGVNQDVTPDMHSSLKGKAYNMVNARVDKRRQGEVFPVGDDHYSRFFIDNAYPPGSEYIFSSGECVCALYVGDHRVSLWNTLAHYALSPDRAFGVIIVDDAIVLMTSSITFDEEHTTADGYAGNGGELFIAGGSITPLILSVEDMVYESTAGSSSTHTEKYFSDFSPEDYGPSFNTDLGKVSFIRLEDKGTGAGLPVGAYVYFYRLVDVSGNRTGWSMSSPTIPVVMQDDTTFAEIGLRDPKQFGFKTYGGVAGDVSPYGVRVRLRLSGSLGFSYVEMGRLSYTSGGPLGDIANFSVTPLLEDADGVSVTMLAGSTQVIDFLDTSKLVWENSSDVLSNQLSQIKSVDTLRYYADRLVYMGITYEDLDLSSLISLKSSSSFGSGYMIPHVRSLEVIGHRSVYNQAMYKSHMHNESVEYGIILHDGKGGTSPVFPLTDVGTFRFPCQREIMQSSTRDFSKHVAAIEGDTTIDDNDLICARMDNTIGWGFSPWSDYSAYIKLLGEDASPYETMYNPYHPVNRADPRIDSRKYYHNFTRAYHNNTSGYASPAGIQGFYPKMFSLGAALSGVITQDLPSWVKGFSVVRSSSDDYIVAQGMAVYDIWNIYDTTIEAIYGINYAVKSQDGFILHFPDLDKSIGISPSVMEDIKRNPSSYHIQLVAPLGFFTEPHGSTDGVTITFPSIPTHMDRDMITHATAMRGNYVNHTDTVATIGDGSSGHVLFGKYRYAAGTNPLASDLGTVWDDPKASYKYPILSAEDLSAYGTHDGEVRELGRSRTTMLKVKIDKDIYQYPYAINALDASAASVRSFHEPFYIVNLVRTGGGISQGNVNKYKTVNQYQRLTSVIGAGNGGELELRLADERVHDNLYVDGKWWYTARNTSDFDAAAQLVLDELRLYGVATVAGYDGLVYGVARFSVVGAEKSVIFSSGWTTAHTSADDPYLYPVQDVVVEMRYNNSMPIELMGGEYIVSEAHSAPVDISYPTTRGDFDEYYGVKLNVGFPYRYYSVGDALWRAGHTTSDYANQLRQWVVKAYVLTKVNIPFITNDAYPNRGYEVKPSSTAFWRDVTGDRAVTAWGNADYVGMLEALGMGANAAYGNAYSFQWLTDYRDDILNIGYGGFSLPQAVNADYSKDHAKQYTSLPSVGFEPVTYFPNRVQWSVPRNASAQDTPGIKTFLASSVWDMDSAQGDITKAFDVRMGGSGGYDLFVFTERGICRLLTNRQLISTMDGDSLGILPAANSFIQVEDWIHKTVGIPKKMIRMAEEHNEQLFFMGDKDVYTFGGEGLQSISGGFFNTLNPLIASILGDSSIKRMGATPYNYYDEVLFMYDGVVYAYNYGVKAWMGTRTYPDVSKMLGDKTLGEVSGYGFNNYLSEDRLDSVTGSNPRSYKDFSLELIAADEPSLDKEHVTVYLMGGVRPDSVEFRTDVNGAAESIISEDHPVPTNNLYMKHYGKGWWTYVPRRLAGSRYREQGNYLVINIKHNTETSGFSVKFVEIGWKPIK